MAGFQPSAFFSIWRDEMVRVLPLEPNLPIQRTSFLRFLVSPIGQVYSIFVSESLIFIRRIKEFKNAFWRMVLLAKLIAKAIRHLLEEIDVAKLQSSKKL